MLFVNVNLNLNVNIEADNHHKNKNSSSQKNIKPFKKQHSTNSLKKTNLKNQQIYKDKESNQNEFILNTNNMKFQSFDPFLNLQNTKTNIQSNARSMTTYNHKSSSKDEKNVFQKHPSSNKQRQQTIQQIKTKVIKTNKFRKINEQIKKHRSYTNCVNNHENSVKNYNKNFNPFIIPNTSNLNFSNIQESFIQKNQKSDSKKNQSTNLNKVKGSRILSYDINKNKKINHNNNGIQQFRKKITMKQSKNIKKQFDGLFHNQRKKMSSSQKQEQKFIDTDGNFRQKEFLKKKNEQKSIQKINRNYDHLGRLIKKRLKPGQINFKTQQQDQKNSAIKQTTSYKKFNFIPMRRSMQMQLQECLNSNLNVKNANLNINFCDKKLIQNNMCLNKLKNSSLHQAHSNELNFSNFLQAFIKNQNPSNENEDRNKNINENRTLNINNSNPNKNTTNNNSNNKLHQSLLNYLADMKILKQTQSILGIQKSRFLQQEKNEQTQHNKKKIKTLGRYHSNHSSYEPNRNKNYINFIDGDNIFEENRRRIIKKHKSKKHFQKEQQKNNDQNQVMKTFLQLKTEYEQNCKDNVKNVKDFKDQNENEGECESEGQVSIQSKKKIPIMEQSHLKQPQLNKKQLKQKQRQKINPINFNFNMHELNKDKKYIKRDIKAQLLQKDQMNKLHPKNNYDSGKNILSFGQRIGSDGFIQENFQSLNKTNINEPSQFQTQSQFNQNQINLKNIVYFISSKLSYKFVSLFTIERINFRVQKKPYIQTVKSKQQKKQIQKTYIIEITLKMYNQIVVQRIKYIKQNTHCETSKKFKPIILQKYQDKNLQKQNIKSYLFSELFANKNYNRQYQVEYEPKMKLSIIQNQKHIQKREREQQSPQYLQINSQKFNPSSRASLQSNQYLQVKKNSHHKHQRLSGNMFEVKSANHHRYSSMSYNSVTSQCYEKIVQYIEKFCTMEISYLGISLRQMENYTQSNILKQIMKKKHSQVQQTLLQTFNLAKVFYHLLKINKTFYVGKCVKIQNRVKYSLLYEFSNLVRHTKNCVIQFQQVLDKSTNKLRNDQLSKHLQDRMIIKFSNQILNNNPLIQNQTNSLNKWNLNHKISSIKKQSLLDAYQICFGQLKQIRNSQCDDEMIYKIYQTNYKNEIKWKRQQYKFYSGISNNFFVYHGAFDFCVITEKERQKNTNVLMNSCSSQYINNQQTKLKSIFRKNMKSRQYKNRNSVFSYYLTKKFELFINYDETRNILLQIQDQFTKEQFLLLYLHKLYKDQYKWSQILDNFLEKNLIQSLIKRNNQNLNKIDSQKINSNTFHVIPSLSKNSNKSFSVIHKNDFFSQTSLIKENINNQNQLSFDNQQKGKINRKKLQKEFYKTIDGKSNIIKVFIEDYDQQNNKWISENPLKSKLLIKVYSRTSLRCYDLSITLKDLFNQLTYFYSMKSNKKIYGKALTNLQIILTNKQIDVLQFRQKLDFYVKRLKLIRKNAYSHYYFNFASILPVNKFDSKDIFSQKLKSDEKNCLNNSIDREPNMFLSSTKKHHKHFNKKLKESNNQPIMTVLYKCLKKVFHGFFIIITLSKVQIFDILQFKVYVNKVHKSFVYTLQQSIVQNFSCQVLTNMFFNFLKNTYFKKIIEKQSNKLSKKYKQFYSHMINEAQTAFISKTRKNKERGVPNYRKVNQKSQFSETDDVSFTELTQEIISVNFNSKRKNKYLIRITYLPNKHYVNQRKGIDETISVNIFRQNSMLIYKFVTNARRLLSKKFSKEHNLFKLQYQEKTKPYYILVDEVKYLIQQSNESTYGLLAAFKRYFLDKNYNNLATNYMISCFSIKMLAGLDLNKIFSELTNQNQSENSIQNTHNKLKQQKKDAYSQYPKQTDLILSDNELNIRNINSDCYQRYCMFVQKIQIIQVLKVRDKQKQQSQSQSINRNQNHKQRNKIDRSQWLKKQSRSKTNIDIKNNVKGILNNNHNKTSSIESLQKKGSKSRNSIDFRLQQNNKDSFFINKGYHLSSVKQHQAQQQEVSKFKSQDEFQQQFQLQQNQCEKIVYLINKETQMIKQITQWNQGGFLSIIPFKKYNKKMFFRLFKNITYQNQEFMEKQSFIKEEYYPQKNKRYVNL